MDFEVSARNQKPWAKLIIAYSEWFWSYFLILEWWPLENWRQSEPLPGHRVRSTLKDFGFQKFVMNNWSLCGNLLKPRIRLIDNLIHWQYEIWTHRDHHDQIVLKIGEVTSEINNYPNHARDLSFSIFAAIHIHITEISACLFSCTFLCSFFYFSCASRPCFQTGFSSGRISVFRS